MFLRLNKFLKRVEKLTSSLKLSAASEKDKYFMLISKILLSLSASKQINIENDSTYESCF